MAGWRPAQSLLRLSAQVDAEAPRRSKVSDGTVSSAAHRKQNPTSDHDPDARGVVRAKDFTHDPDGGFDAHAFADRLLAAQDPRLRYVISNGRIGSGPAGPQPGVWRPYGGDNPHTKHIHVSVTRDLGDRDGAWNVRPPEGKPEMTKAEMDEIKRHVTGAVDYALAAVTRQLDEVKQRLTELEKKP